MGRRLCQAVGGRTRWRQLDTSEGLGAAWSTGASQNPQPQPGTLPSHTALCYDCGLTGSLTGHTQLESLVLNKTLLRGKSLGLHKNRFKKSVIKHRALL